MKAYEVNFDGIVGPTHNYSGLSFGNVASLNHKMNPSNPKEAALQGLEKMRLLHDLGVKQAVLPPHERPYIPVLRALGFTGKDSDILIQASQTVPEIFESCCSAAAMWTANAATMTPSLDSFDHKLHLTAANLSNKFHRSIEAATTTRILQAIFSNSNYFTIHQPLPAGAYFSDEGAANHTRFCRGYDQEGIHLFVYGKHSFSSDPVVPKRYPARQTIEASQAIARQHQVKNALFVQQNPAAIDAGVFHNDVISVGNEKVFLYHEEAFVGGDAIVQQLQEKMSVICHQVHSSEVSLKEAVDTYLFNSQLVTLPNGKMAMIAPKECQNVRTVFGLLERLKNNASLPIQDVYYLDLHQSMRNGGGPACLRLRVVMNETEIAHANEHVFFTPELHETLKNWVNEHYRDRLLPQDLKDPLLMEESRKALETLTNILHLGSIYDFQK